MRFHVVFFCVVLSANLTSFLRAQYITLKIPHNDLADEKFSTFSTKRYYFVTYFKVTMKFDRETFFSAYNFDTSLSSSGEFLSCTPILSAEWHGTDDGRLERRGDGVLESDQQ